MSEMRKLMENFDRAMNSGRETTSDLIMRLTNRIAELELYLHDIRDWVAEVGGPDSVTELDYLLNKAMSGGTINEENSIGKQQKAKAIYDYIMGGDFDLDTMMDMGIRVDDESVGEAVDDWIGSLDSREFEEMYQDAKECHVSEAITAESQPDPTVAEQKLDDLRMEFAQTLMAISGFYSSDDPRSMFRNEMEQFEADVSELLDKMGFFNDN